MALLDIWLGNTKEERDALARLGAWADRVFELQPNEERDLAVHVHADIPRFRLLHDRAALLQAQTSRKSDRNWYTLVVLGVLLLAKGVVTPTAIWDAIRGLLGLG